KQGDVVVIDRETRESRVIASFPPREDPQVEAGSFRAVDVTALPDPSGGSTYVASASESADTSTTPIVSPKVKTMLSSAADQDEPAAGHMYALNRWPPE